MTHLSRLLAPLVIAAALLSAVPAAAQSLTAGALAGTVRDPGGAPVAGALVTVSDASGTTERSLGSGPDGAFTVSLLAPGTYDVLVERIGFRPKRVTGVPVGAGEQPRVAVTLTPAPRADVVETAAYPAGVRGGFGAPGRLRFTADDLASLPAERRELGAVPSFSSLLPPPEPAGGGAGRGWVVDGVPFTAVRLPAGVADPLAAAALSFRSLERAELLSAPADVEWPGTGGAFLHALTRRGTQRFAAGAEGSYAGGSLESRDGFPSASVSHSAVEGGAWAGGPLGGGGAFSLGVDVRSRETPLQLASRPGDLAAALAQVALDSFGVSLGAPDVVKTDVGSAFARFDAPLGGGHTLAVRAAGATLLSPERRAPSWLAGGGGEAKGSDLLASATVTSPLGGGLGVETRLSFEHSGRDFSADSADALLPFTRVLAGGLGFGGNAAFPGSFSRTALGATAAVHYRFGAHQVKAGGGASFVTHDRAYAAGAAGEFTFTSAEDFAAGRGAYAQTLGASPAAAFSLPRFSAFAQETFTPAPGVELSIGARWDLERLPAGELPLDADWGVRTGIATAALRPSASRVSPRASITVEPAGSGWRFRAEGGLFSGESDPAYLAEAIGSGADLRVRRGLDVPWSFSGAPDSAAVPRVARTLTFLTPEWAPPRDARAGVSVSRALPGGAAAHVALDWRRTDFLPRRADLNLLREPSGQDQHGRPLFGTLLQRGGLLVAEPGTNRVFPDFDRVSAIDLDGKLDWTAVTVALERRPAAGLRLLAAYTWSQTRDNLPSALGLGAGEVQAPFLGEAAGDWSDGTSDFDVPHRAVAIAELRGGGARTPSLALVYRLRSGSVFTPGYRAGVDANGDGSPFNDPAFVDPAVEGFTALAAEWGCLDALSGSFAARNACRAPTVHGLDARLGVDVLRRGAHGLRLTVDGLNLLGSERGPVDAALYLVDPSRPLTTDASGRVVVPLLANPGFGEPLLRRATGRTLRIGLQLSY